MRRSPVAGVTGGASWLAVRVAALLLLPATASAAPRIDPAHARNITVYHVNPSAAGAIPVNMDTGDALGDLFFDLFEVIIYPLACPSGQASGGRCQNPEASGDLNVNKLTLEVDSRFSGYAMCNICVNSTDGRGHHCPSGTYFCYCSTGAYPGRAVPCNRTVGQKNIVDAFGRFHHIKRCLPFMGKTMCYTSAVFNKLAESSDPAYWYSSLDTGYCDMPGHTGDSCTWRVVAVDKVVTRKCHSRVFGDIVQATQSPACLDACGSQKTNTSSPCWVDCFYRAAAGPDSGKPFGKAGGMSLAALTAAWEHPFLPEHQGGCPPVQPEPPWFAPKAGIVV